MLLSSEKKFHFQRKVVGAETWSLVEWRAVTHSIFQSLEMGDFLVQGLYLFDSLLYPRIIPVDRRHSRNIYGLNDWVN